MPLKTLSANIDSIGFINREKTSSGKILKFRCGRDFLYYTLNYYYPDQFNPSCNNALQLEESRAFGLRLPWWLMWTQLQFKYLSKLLARLNLQLSINNKVIKSFSDFLQTTTIPQKTNVKQKLKEIENAVDLDFASGIDISLGLGGLVDHVLFVYGYDESNLYVFDTYQVPKLEYDKITKNEKYYMRLPKSIIRKRWSRFGRVWLVNKI